ncbi:hypothetical protein B9Z55_007176 [Caenorhabditis nigoni]|uniref:7TM GPCR serpentine receptor class x (Srx) domain-containing protein n=1 Tax=Caenorhabditis nigoni TaxID=1611254 RepID=A0A2G5V8E8_9PELO|nr:hypothetical protein B9Z55_007176 [Caenorhabditis nigoni]
MHLTIFMQMVPLYPILAHYTAGLFSKYFDFSAHANAGITAVIVIVQLEFLTLCFEKKHKAIAIIMDTHIIPSFLEFIGYTLGVICPTMVFVLLGDFRVPENERMEYIAKNYPSFLPGFQSLSHFDIYRNSPSYIICFALLVLGGLTLCVQFLFFITDMLRLMRVLKHRISSRTFQKHQEAIQSLMIQFATSSMCLLPPCFLKNRKAIYNAIIG